MSDVAPNPSPRLAVFVSGGGRTLVNLHDHIANGALRAHIAVVIASSHCCALPKAHDRGIPFEVHPGEIPADRLAAILAPYRPDLLVLAGYVKRLHIPPAFAGRVVNIHPALLPRFGGPGMYGRRVHEAVLGSGEPESGCTVHLCNEEYDAGSILLQKRCPVLPGDTPDTLAARVFELEREAYPQAIKMLLATMSPQRPAQS